MGETIVIICPDTNIKLWASRTRETSIGGGKSAILQLAAAWARSGHSVTIAGSYVEESEEVGLRVCQLSHAAGTFDIAIYVTGSAGHFNDPSISGINGAIRILWINGTYGRAVPPPGRVPDWIITPARFLARKAIDEWDLPTDRVVVIPGEAVTRRLVEADREGRDDFALVYASHPFKGLENAVEIIGRVRADFPQAHLDVYGSATLWGDALDSAWPGTYPDWVSFKGSVAQNAVEEAMPRYGAMLYLTKWIDGFSLATAEALGAGVITIATRHGSQAEFIRHGWNGWLVSSNEEFQPDLSAAEKLLRAYLSDPKGFADMRRRAIESVPTWDEQASCWERIWSSTR